jgi:hypothetical protein
MQIYHLDKNNKIHSQLTSVEEFIAAKKWKTQDVGVDPLYLFLYGYIDILFEKMCADVLVHSMKLSNIHVTSLKYLFYVYKYHHKRLSASQQPYVI